jgi:hypothetical protein
VSEQFAFGANDAPQSFASVNALAVVEIDEKFRTPAPAF